MTYRRHFRGSDPAAVRITERYAAVAVLAIAAGCGETNQQVIDEYRGRFAEKRAQLAAIAASLPPADSVSGNSCTAPLDPRPVFRSQLFLTEEDRARNNTDVLMADQLVDPDVDLRARGAWDLLLSQALLSPLQWTGPKNPLSAGSRRAAPSFRKHFDQALGLRYLVVGRVVADVPPRIVSEKSFVPGRIAVEGLVVDLATQAVVCSVFAAAQSDPSVSYSYKVAASGQRVEDPLTEAAQAAHSNLWQNVRFQLVDALAATTGGTFEVDDERKAKPSP